MKWWGWRKRIEGKLDQLLAKGVLEMSALTDLVAAEAAIATGIVVVGDLLGSGESQERGIVGGTPHEDVERRSSLAALPASESRGWPPSLPRR